VGRFEKELLSKVKASNPQLLETIRTQKQLSAEAEADLKATIEAFAKTFAA
jgi:F-type H+-transporting ATPase subunit alpha